MSSGKPSEETSATQGGDGARKPSVADLPQETLDFAAKCFDLARNGSDDILKLYLDAGLPANLTNEKGTSSLLSTSL